MIKLNLQVYYDKKIINKKQTITLKKSNQKNTIKPLADMTASEALGTLSKQVNKYLFSDEGRLWLMSGYIDGKTKPTKLKIQITYNNGETINEEENINYTIKTKEKFMVAVEQFISATILFKWMEAYLETEEGKNWIKSNTESK